ncbi:MAG: hypothetical protein AAF662_16150 [Pseudomonadota bacterium]
MEQITINYEAPLTTAWATCREYVASRIHSQGKPQKAIAADMDYSPSDLTRKLAQSPNDSRRFTLDDLETFIEVTGDTSPITYLAEKYLKAEAEKERLLARIAELEARPVRKVGAA